MMTKFRNELDSAIAIVRDDDRAFKLESLVHELPIEFLPILLDSARAFEYKNYRYRIFALLALQLAKFPCQQSLIEWHRTIPILAAHGRSEFLSDLAAIIPWLESFATLDDLAAIAQAIIDVSRVWP